MATERPLNSSVLLTVTGGEKPMGGEPPKQIPPFRSRQESRKSPSGPSPPTIRGPFRQGASGEPESFVRPRGLPQLRLRRPRSQATGAGEARLKLMGKFRGDPDAQAFPIGAG